MQTLPTVIERKTVLQSSSFEGEQVGEMELIEYAGTFTTVLFWYNGKNASIVRVTCRPTTLDDGFNAFNWHR